MCNNDGTKRTPPPPLWSNWQKDTGIAHGITDLGHPNNLAPNTYDVWDISGPTTAADPTANGSTYELYENISPNGWNLAWNVIITETSPTGQMKFLNQKGTWQTGQTTTGIMFYYNPKAYALALGSSAANKLMGSNANYWVPPVTKNKTTGAKDNAGAASRYDNLVSASWVNIAPLPPCLDFYVIHSQTTKFVGTTSNVPGSNIGSNLWYCENRCGYQFIGSAGGFPPPPDAVQAWTDIPVTFKKDHSYLANVAMVNVATQISGSPTTVGPGLANVDALTYLELIV